MVRRVPALLFLVPFEHREIDHPEEPEIAGVEQLVAIVILLGGEQPQLPAGLQHRFGRPMALGLRGPAGQQQQIVLAGAGALAARPPWGRGSPGPAA